MASGWEYLKGRVKHKILSPPPSLPPSTSSTSSYTLSIPSSTHYYDHSIYSPSSPSTRSRRNRPANLQALTPLSALRLYPSRSPPLRQCPPALPTMTSPMPIHRSAPRLPSPSSPASPASTASAETEFAVHIRRHPDDHGIPAYDLPVRKRKLHEHERENSDSKRRHVVASIFLPPIAQTLIVLQIAGSPRPASRTHRAPHLHLGHHEPSRPGHGQYRRARGLEAHPGLSE